MSKMHDRSFELYIFNLKTGYITQKLFKNYTKAIKYSEYLTALTTRISHST